jgi:hypothetical protein
MGKEPASSRSDAKFGQAPTYNSDVGFVIAVTDDKKAFTATFSGLAVTLDPNSSTPVVGRAFSFSLPLSDAAPGTEIPFFVQGFVLCENGANGHFVFSINDQTTVVDFCGGSDTSFLHQTKFKVGSASEVRITVFLLVDRDSKSKATASLNVSTIDTDITKHPS